MRPAYTRWLPLAAFLLVCFSASGLPGALFAQSTAPTTNAAQLTVSGDVAKPLTLTLADLAQMPRKNLTVTGEHDKKQDVYEGVLLADILSAAGAPLHGKLRGPAIGTYVEADASDGYRVIFSLAELDSDFLNSEVLVADKLNGQPLLAAGPLRLIVPHDKRPARWVRNLQSIDVVTVAAPK